MRVRAERHHGGGNIEGLAAVLDQTDMIEPRVVADRNDQRIVGLIDRRALGRDIAFHQRRAGRLAELQQRTGEHRRRRATAGDMNHMQRLGQHHAVGDLDHHAVGHHRRIQRNHRIGIVGREQLRLQRGVALLQHFAQRADGKAFLRVGKVGQFWREHAIDQHQLAHAVDGVQLQRVAGLVSAAASGAAASGSTSRISTRRSVYFQSSMRRCGRPARS